MDSQISISLIEILRRNIQTLATAESCTGGLVAHYLTNVPGASDVFFQGMITYSEKAKIDLLKVPPILLERFGAASHEVAGAMAEGVKSLSNATFGLATTGIAGPAGGTVETPVGTVFFAIAQNGKKTIMWHDVFSGDRVAIKEQAAESLLRRLLFILMQHA